jgi:signal transduction histidine kinase/ligand-binding sensor domain-containing protein/CheY-like chemotaxis protein/HPt (histidine-containing phosphotransfer) domain-containing protein
VKTVAATRRIAAFIAACGLWMTCARAADAPALILDHLTPSEGMPQGTVMATLQDSQGFVWLGTEDGLVRYDGHDLVRYAYSRNAPQGLPGNFIFEIVEDRRQDLWLAVKDAGLARWNRRTDDFTIFRHNPADAASLASDSIRAVLIDAQGRVWVGTNGAGIDILDPDTGRAVHLRHDPNVNGSLANDRIFSFTQDREGAIWVATADGLDQWQPGRQDFVHFRHDAHDPYSLSGRQISQVVEDAKGALWVGTYDGGLDRMDRSGRVDQVFRHDARQGDSLVTDEVRAVLADQAGHLWVGTSSGLDLLEPTTGTFTHYRHDENDAGSLRDSYVMSLYEDPAGLIWIGTRSGGVSRWNPRSWELGASRPEWLVGRLVTSFADAPDRKVWIGSLGGGLMQFDDKTGAVADIDAIVKRRNALGDARVMALQTDRRGSLWIGTMTNGLKRLAADGRLQSIPVKVGDPKSVSAAGIMSLFESRRGEIWIGTHGGGANVFDPVTGTIRQLAYDAGTHGAASVTAIAEGQRGEMWLGTDGGGLTLADADGQIIKVFRHDPADANSVPSNTIYAVAVDDLGSVWVATDQGGIARVDGSAARPQEIRFHTVSREDGLSSDTIYAILGDAAGNLWLSGNAGLMRYDPRTRAVKTFHREHGLQGEEFDLNAYHRLRDGRLCFGGPGGFNIFDPARLTENTHAPRVVLTRLEILGAPAPGTVPYWLLDRISLDHRASIVSLDFAALDFTSPKRNRLAYRVSGLSDRWIELGEQHRVTLTNLDAGDHLLEVRAANADSVWSAPPLRLNVHREPAPWRSPWAYALYAIAILLLIAHRLHLNRVKIESIVSAKRRLELEVDLRTRELRESNRQLAEASEAKSNFLARMSHELRTPMNGVVGSSELLARTPQSRTQARLTETIRSSAKVLLQIVNDLLDLSRIQAGKLEFEILPFELLPVLEESATLFAAAARTKGVELIVCVPPVDVPPLVGDSLRIRQILLNLIGNAVKFTQKGEVVIKADVVPIDCAHVRLQFSIADTGIGMDAATLTKIFEPFTQADESTTRRYGGSGLGLAICRELTDRMGGTIAVESRPRLGSTFNVSIPLEVTAEMPARAIDPGPLPRLKILTRRPALRDAITRHATALGMRVSPPADEACAVDELVIVDLDTHERFVESLVGAAPGRWPVLVVADGPVGEALPAYPPGRALLIDKPVLRDALREALRVALGASPARGPAPAHEVSRFDAFDGHVLLVEDEPVNAAVAQGYLAELGCSCVWIDNGADAMARYASERFDLIMMDINMPGMDGFATSRLIREFEGTGRHVPIVALTAHVAKDYRRLCIESGMDEVLSKPYTFEECATLLRRFLGAAKHPRVSTVVTGATAPVSPAHIRALSVVDEPTVNALRTLRGAGDHSLYSTLVELFRTSSTASVAQLQAALVEGDCELAATICHKLVAAAANVGALAFSREARSIESACTARDLIQVRQQARGLTASHQSLIEELAARQLRDSA